MRIAIFSCCTGGGHNSAARAVEEAAREAGHQADVVDFLKLSGPVCDRAFGQSYVDVVKKAPQLFGAVYKLGGKISDADRLSPVFAVNALLSGALEAYLSEKPADALVATHIYPADAFRFLRDRRGLAAPTVAVATDYTCIPFWEETRCDRYVLPSSAAVEEFAARGIPRDKLLPYGIPVGGRFSAPCPQGEARRELGLDRFARVYLIMGGSMGYGDLPDICDALLRRKRPEDGIVVICGGDGTLFAALQTRYGGVPSVRIVGYTPDVADYMAACDVLFTKPGGLSTTEAAVERVPIIHTFPIPGCETENLAYFTREGMSRTSDSPEGLAEAGVALASDPQARAEMRRRQEALIPTDAAAQVVGLLERLTAKKEPEDE